MMPATEWKSGLTEVDIALLRRLRELRDAATRQPQHDPEHRMPTSLRFGFVAWLDMLRDLDGSKHTVSTNKPVETYLGYPATEDSEMPRTAIDILDQDGKQIDRLEGGKWLWRPEP